MPCTEKRARKLMEKKQAKPYWYNNIFCIILQKEPSARNIQRVIFSVDPGSQREGYEIAAPSRVLFCFHTNTPEWVKKRVETSANLCHSRRGRNTPYRPQRENRNIKIKGPQGSTRARWGFKLRNLEIMSKLYPIDGVAVEDIKAKTVNGKKKNGKSRKWNKSFSPLECGKNWFYSKVKELGYKLFLFQGHETYEHRKARGFTKTSQKLANKWNAHCVDAHCLVEMVLGEIEPDFQISYLEYLQFNRRSLHVQNPSKGGERRKTGGTISMGIKKGTIGRTKKYGLVYIGGSSLLKDKYERLSFHNIKSGKRLTQYGKKEDFEILSNIKYRRNNFYG